MKPLYDEDYARWAEETAAALREGRFEDVDTVNAAEEIESLSRSDQRELHARLAVLVAHLLKWQYQPELRGPSWLSTIAVQRRDIGRLLADSPSLRGKLDFEKAYRDGRDQAVLEAGPLAFPLAAPFTMEQALDGAFLPV